MSRLIDISPLVHEGLQVWPGDVPYRRKINARLADGATIDLSSIETSVHLGAHADAPSHYRQGLPGIAERSLEIYYGPCEVIAARVPRGARIRPSDLPGPVRAPRVLFRTESFPDPTDFTTDFAALSPELVRWLAAQGVVLVGLDTPSVDPFDDKDLRSHQAIADHDLAILEGLVLSHVEPGLYTLFALPLKLDGADASPVRAALLRD